MLTQAQVRLIPAPAVSPPLLKCNSGINLSYRQPQMQSKARTVHKSALYPWTVART